MPRSDSGMSSRLSSSCGSASGSMNSHFSPWFIIAQNCRGFGIFSLPLRFLLEYAGARGFYLTGIGKSTTWTSGYGI